MGFSHRVSSAIRADVLSAAAEQMYLRSGDMKLYTLARSRNQAFGMAERDPGNDLKQRQVCRALLHGPGLSTDLPAPRLPSAAWRLITHIFEQKQQSRIIRPESEYIGVRDRRWIPLELRQPMQSVR
jgi:citrate synthase